ncbi:phosphotransferase [Micromonospora sp. NPDC049275]|uniref:phosphotransferase n=1 Tax=Micromonospora sp. NPDC049275 TaxID=3364268 RepID=UPI00371281A5
MAESHAPVVEMLWEAHDPRETLGGRFGFSDGDSAGRWIADTLDEHWGVRVDSCERIVMSGGNALAWIGTPAGRMLAKWSVVPDRFPRLAAIARLTSWLDGQGLPVSAPVAARDGSLQVEACHVSMGLQRVIAGELLDTADPAQVWAAGALLARLQEALAACPHPDPDPASTYSAPAEPLAARVIGWLDTHTEQVPTTVSDALRGLVAAAPADPLPRQLLHSDYRAANILCVGTEIVAVLDFEEAQQDHPVVELARSAVLLGTRYHDWGPVPVTVHAQFRAGYESVRRLSAVEAAWWDIVVLWQTLTFVPPGTDPTGWEASALSQLHEG